MRQENQLSFSYWPMQLTWRPVDIRRVIHGGRLNKANNRCLFIRLPGQLALVHPAVGWIVGNSPGSRANNIYLPGSDKLSEV